MEDDIEEDPIRQALQMSAGLEQMANSLDLVAVHDIILEQV